MARNRKSRISEESVSVEGIDHLVGYEYLSKQQKKVQFHCVLAGVFAHFIHPIELANGRRVLSRGFAGRCRTIAGTGAGGGADFK
jgi:hypothetical protein